MANEYRFPHSGLVVWERDAANIRPLGGSWVWMAIPSRPYAAGRSGPSCMLKRNHGDQTDTMSAARGWACIPALFPEAYVRVRKRSWFLPEPRVPQATG